jgi:hypothetical protein
VSLKNKKERTKNKGKEIQTKERKRNKNNGMKNEQKNQKQVKAHRKTNKIDKCLNTVSWTLPRDSAQIVERKRAMKLY